MIYEWFKVNCQYRPRIIIVLYNIFYFLLRLLYFAYLVEIERFSRELLVCINLMINYRFGEEMKIERKKPYNIKLIEDGGD